MKKQTEVILMHIDVLMICITILLAVAAVVVIAFLVVKPYLNKMSTNNEMHIINEKYALFNSIDSDSIGEKLDKYFSEYVNRYVIYKFVSKKITYIKDNEVETMVSDLTKFIAVDISELYIFYIKMSTSITDQDSLLLYIKNKVRAEVVDVVSSYNKANIDPQNQK